MKRSLGVLVGTILVALPAVGAVSASAPRPKQPNSSEPATSTAVKASFASGTAANRMAVKVSTHGNLISFESPGGQEAVYGGREGYVLCTGDGGTVHGHDTGDLEAGFGAPTFVQPNAGKFPLTVTRNTTGGALQLKQVWSKPDATGMRVILAMTVKNLSSAALSGVTLVRTGDFDVGPSGDDLGAATGDSTWLWDDRSGSESPAAGLMLTALSFATVHDASVEPIADWNNATSPTRDNCYGWSPNTPLPEGDYGLRMIYSLGALGAGQSKTVKLAYARM